MANMNCATLDSDVGIHISNFSGCDCLACVPENNESAQISLVDLEEMKLSKHSLPWCPLSPLWIWMGHSNTCCLSVLEHSCFFLGACWSHCGYGGDTQTHASASVHWPHTMATKINTCSPIFLFQN